MISGKFWNKRGEIGTLLGVIGVSFLLALVIVTQQVRNTVIQQKTLAQIVSSCTQYCVGIGADSGYCPLTNSCTSGGTLSSSSCSKTSNCCCVYNPVPTSTPYLSPTPQSPSCIDTDGGQNYNTKGTITFCTVNSSGVKNCASLTDTCTLGSVNEYFCSGTSSNYTQYACPNGCSNGACIGPTSTPTTAPTPTSYPYPATCGCPAGNPYQCVQKDSGATYCYPSPQPSTDVSGWNCRLCAATPTPATATPTPTPYIYAACLNECGKLGYDMGTCAAKGASCPASTTPHTHGYMCASSVLCCCSYTASPTPISTNTPIPTATPIATQTPTPTAKPYMCTTPCTSSTQCPATFVCVGELKATSGPKYCFPGECGRVPCSCLPTATPTRAPTPTALPTSPITPTKTPTPINTSAPTATRTPTPTIKLSPTITSTPKPTNTIIPGLSPTKTPTPTPTPVPSTTIVLSTTPGVPCIHKKTGDADCKVDSLGRWSSLIDFEIWRSEKFGGCQYDNLSACGSDADGDGNPMDANFNYPGSGNLPVEQNALVDIVDFNIWLLKGFNVENGIRLK